MTTRLTRTRVKAAALALAAITAASAAAAPAIAAARSRPAAVTASAGVPVVVNCSGHAQVRPRQYILTCADGNFSLTALNWAAWGSSAAFASGVSELNDCFPNCASGRFHRFPALAVLWRAEPRPGHRGQRYFTRLTLIYTGNHSYRAGGRLHVLPATATYPLSAAGGL